MDASFLYMETPSLHMHVVGTLVLDPSTMRGGFSFERMREVISSRFHVMPGFRQKLRTVPFNLDHPVWVDDPDFDIDRHLNHSALPKPGDMHQLARLVGRIASVPLERDHPLWQMWVIEGLEHDHIALVSKIHHSTIDGVTGADLIAHLFDFEPDAPDPKPPDHEWSPRPEPNDFDLIADAVRSRASTPLRTATALARTTRSLANVGRSALGLSPGTSTRPALPFSAPRTQFNRTVSAKRSVAYGKAKLDDVKQIKSAFGTTVNDVVLTACTQSLRRFLVAHHDLPDRPLICSVPVSVHGRSQAEGTNQVSNMFVRLPIQIEDPVEQLLAVHEETKDAKQVHNAMGADLIQDLAQMTPPGVFNLAARLYSGAGLANQLPPIQNLIISNVPGPPVPLYIAGARVIGIYPFGPLLESTGMNITVLSNMDNMDFGVIADGATVPDPWPIADGFSSAIDDLRAAADKVTKN
jgi:WS/DGAT/MGAT family acyltransferase